MNERETEQNRPESASRGAFAAASRPLSGRRALVVGGSGGIGREVTRRLASAGAEVVVHGRSPERLRGLEQEIEAMGATVRSVARELARSEDGIALVEAVLPVDVLIVSFGPFLEKPILETTMTEWRRQAELNLLLPAGMVSRAAEAMRQRGYGRIVLFGGTATDRLRGFRTVGAYSAVKTGAMVLVKSVARELAGTNVTIHGICPAPVDTEYLGEDQRRRYRKLVPGGQLLTPGEVAESVLSLVSREDNALNGTVLPVDRGGV